MVTVFEIFTLHFAATTKARTVHHGLLLAGMVGRFPNGVERGPNGLKI